MAAAMDPAEPPLPEDKSDTTISKENDNFVNVENLSLRMLCDA